MLQAEPSAPLIGEPFSLLVRALRSANVPPDRLLRPDSGSNPWYPSLEERVQTLPILPERFAHASWAIALWAHGKEYELELNQMTLSLGLNRQIATSEAPAKRESETQFRAAK